MQPVLQQKCQTQSASLGNPGQTMNIVKSESKHTAAEDREENRTKPQEYHSFCHRVSHNRKNVKNGNVRLLSFGSRRTMRSCYEPSLSSDEQ